MHKLCLIFCSYHLLATFNVRVYLQQFFSFVKLHLYFFEKQYKLLTSIFPEQNLLMPDLRSCTQLSFCFMSGLLQLVQQFLVGNENIVRIDSRKQMHSDATNASLSASTTQQQEMQHTDIYSSFCMCEDQKNITHGYV